MSTTESKKVIVFGSTGAIGTSLIELITEEYPDWKVLAVSRSGSSSKSRLASLNLSNVEFVKGDVGSIEDVRNLTDDVDICYCCVGFPKYERRYWAEHWPVVVDNLLSVTSESRPLVFCDNLYAYGPTTDITTETPRVEPSTKSKPAIRSALRVKFEERMNTQPKALTVVGGADFYGPHVTDKSFLGDTFVGNMVQGKKPLAVGTSTAIHDFCYAKDFANALLVASVNLDKSTGKFWICPHSIHGKTMSDVANDVRAILPKSPEGCQVLPTFMVNILGLFMSFMSELVEMLPFWTKDYSISGDKDFCEEFGVSATPYEKTLEDMVEFYQGHK